jgi:hypothetical protein
MLLRSAERECPLKKVRFVVLLLSACLTGVLCVAQTPSVATAPVPQAILAAKNIFLSNAGADSGLFPHPFSGGPERAYNQLYAAVKGMGRYELVGSPAEADLVLELRLFAPNGPANANKQKGASDPLPMFRLVVYDAKTHYVLWALTESIDSAALQKTHDRNFDEALTNLANDFKAIGTSASATSTTAAQ